MRIGTTNRNGLILDVRFDLTGNETRPARLGARALPMRLESKENGRDGVLAFGETIKDNVPFQYRLRPGGFELTYVGDRPLIIGDEKTSFGIPAHVTFVFKRVKPGAFPR